MSDKSESRSGPDAGTQSVRVEKGECVVLSPGSDRFKDSYRQVRPRTAKELREVIGLSQEMSQTLRDQDMCCQQLVDRSAIVSIEELDSPDDAIRARALDTTDKALHTYVLSTNPAVMGQMEPAFERYLGISDVVLNVLALQDIHVADGSTLTVSDDTHLIEANRIVMHGSGRIDCNGFTKFNVASIEGS